MPDNNKPPGDCQQPAYHRMHLCILRHISKQEVDQLTLNPAYRCLRCDLKADQGENLCQPKRI